MEQLPADMVSAYERYLKRPLLTRELLAAKLRPYLQVISEAAKTTPRLDIGTAGELGAALLRLLRECDDDQLPRVQAATLYFVEADDSEPDLESAQGFRDDALFFNAVCREIGREDLLLQIGGL